MHVPEHFKITDHAMLAALLRDHPFGTLVTLHDDLPFASHLPFLCDVEDGRITRLWGHLARNNPQCTDLATGQTALAMFTGPHAYVSPSWYASPGVPTWNYAVVHIYGTVHITDDRAALRSRIAQLTRIFESAQSIPWQPDLEGRHDGALNRITGFSVEVTEVQGKFKLSQNRGAEDRRRVAQEFAASGAPSAEALARLMREIGSQ